MVYEDKKKEAVLEVEGSSIYISGDKSKTDLLSIIKEGRNNAEKERKKIWEEQGLEKYVALKSEFQEIAQKYAMPSELGSFILSELKDDKEMVKIRPTNYGEMYFFPKSSSNNELYSDTLQNNSDRLYSIYTKYEEALKRCKPTTLTEKLFSRKKFKEKYDGIASVCLDAFNFYRESVQRIKSFDSYKSILEEYFRTGKHLKVEEFAEYDHYEMGRVLQKYETLTKRLATGHIISDPINGKKDDLYGIMPDESKRYLEKNGLTLSLDTFIDAVKKTSNMPEEMKMEIVNLFPSIKTTVPEEKKKSTPVR